MYDFDKVVDRRGTSSIKWNFQEGFGQHDGLLPYWIADTDFATVPEVMQAIQKRCSARFVRTIIKCQRDLPGRQILFSRSSLPLLIRKNRSLPPCVF